ncbi:MAG: hypothetical protein IKT70_08670 [Clostridia bacterium]|nr:hypothetical protein [Clostridia bacterium]
MNEKYLNRISNLQSLMFADTEWYVLCRKKGRLFIMSKNIIGIKPYDNVFETELWETCQLRKYLNTEYLKQFSFKDRKRIIKTFNINENNPLHKTFGGNSTHDYIFILGLDEVNKYLTPLHFFADNSQDSYEHSTMCLFSDINDAKRVSFYQNISTSWWLRCPGENSNSAVAILNDGRIALSGLDLMAVLDVGGVGFRPVLWIKDDKRQD